MVNLVLSSFKSILNTQFGKTYICMAMTSSASEHIYMNGCLLSYSNFTPLYYTYDVSQVLVMETTHSSLYIFCHAQNVKPFVVIPTAPSTE